MSFANCWPSGLNVLIVLYPTAMRVVASLRMVQHAACGVPSISLRARFDVPTRNISNIGSVLYWLSEVDMIYSTADKVACCSRIKHQCYGNAPLVSFQDYCLVQFTRISTCILHPCGVLKSPQTIKHQLSFIWTPYSKTSRPTLYQIMIWYLTAPSHHLIKCWPMWMRSSGTPKFDLGDDNHCIYHKIYSRDFHLIDIIFIYIILTRDK